MVLSKLEKPDFLMKIRSFHLQGEYKVNDDIFHQNQVPPTLKEPFSKLYGPILINFDVLESSKWLYSSVQKFGAGWGDQTTPSPN